MKPRRPKRRKTNAGTTVAPKNQNRTTRTSTSIAALLDLFQQGLTIRTAPETEHGDHAERKIEDEHPGGNGFEATMEGFLPEYLEARHALWAQSSSTTLSVRRRRRQSRRGVRFCSHLFYLRQSDNRGAGGQEGEGELVRPLSRFETGRIMALARQRMAGRVTFPTERIVLRKLQLSQVRISVKTEDDTVISCPFSGETQSGDKGVTLAGY